MIADAVSARSVTQLEASQPETVDLLRVARVLTFDAFTTNLTRSERDRGFPGAQAGTRVGPRATGYEAR